MDRPYLFNGAWLFTDDNNRGMWDARKVILLPRVGIAIRVNDRTSIRAGWARFNTPAILSRPTGDVLGSTPVQGFGADTPVAPNVDGVPRQRLNNPFPADVNPVVMPVGKGDGRYTEMGGSPTWDMRKLTTAVNDRFNLALQRETVGRFVVEGTYFFNAGLDLPYNLDLNLVNPEIINREGSNITKQVANPSYQLLPFDKMRGPLRNQKTVSLQSLLTQYPQYTTVRQVNTNGIREHYHSFQFRAQRPFANGFNLLLAYNYNQESVQEFYNKEETFLNSFRWMDGRRPLPC